MPEEERKRKGLILLTPSAGYSYLTNGDVWSQAVYLGKNDDISNWHDTNELPPNIESIDEYITPQTDSAE